MSQLLFQKRFFDAIRSGQKQTTIRRWQYERVKPGRRAFVPGLGELFIDSIGPISLGSLRKADAIADGFASLAAMRRTLREIYPPEQIRNDGRTWYRIRFHHDSTSQGIAKPRASKPHTTRQPITRETLAAALTAALNARSG